MNWNAPIPAWAVLLMVIVLALLVLYFALLATNRQRAKDLRYAAAQRTIDALVTERDGARDQRDKLNTENADLHAQLADRNEALAEAQAEIKSLNMRTVELPEVTPEPAKRPTRTGKKGAS